MTTKGDLHTVLVYYSLSTSARFLHRVTSTPQLKHTIRNNTIMALALGTLADTYSLSASHRLSIYAIESFNIRWIDHPIGEHFRALLCNANNIARTLLYRCLLRQPSLQGLAYSLFACNLLIYKGNQESYPQPMLQGPVCSSKRR